jgi:hypothetical protein
VKSTVSRGLARLREDQVLTAELDPLAGPADWRADR